MIELTRTHDALSEWNVKVLGVGGAGCHAADRLAKDGLAGVELLVANTDTRALSTTVIPDRIVLGQRLTRGLGTGGDPELGRAAALESLEQLKARFQGASLVILLVGLGGGTGSGAAPCIAEAARSVGAHVAVFATLPFTFEGRRRREQALEGLDALRQHANLVICFENDRMSAVADPASGIEDAFESVDTLLAQAVRAIAGMTRRKNVMHSGLDEIAATVSGHRSTALFGYGVAEGEERAQAAVVRSFSNPLFDSEKTLASASRLWVFVTGGADLRWSEVQSLMEAVTDRISPEVKVFFGAAVDPSMAGSVAVTLLAGLPADLEAAAKEPPPARDALQSFSAPLGRAEAPALRPQSFPAREPLAAASEQVLEPGAWEEASSEPLSQDDSRGQEDVDHENHEWKPLRLASRAKISQDETAAPHPHEADLHEAHAHEAHAPEAFPALFSEEPEVPKVGQRVPPRTVPVPPYELTKERRGESVKQPSHPAAPAVEPPVAEPAIYERPAPPVEPSPGSTAASGDAPGQNSLQPPGEPMAPPVSMKRPKDNPQAQMRFEGPHRGGRFEKTDPTIVDGEDLDVPTFMRQRLPLE